MNITLLARCFRSISWKRCDAARSFPFKAIASEGGLAKIPAHLFGKRVQLPSGPFALAQVAQVPIYPLFVARSGYRSYQIIVHEPIVVPRTGRRREEDIAPAVEKWQTILEETIKEHWDQWFAFTPGFLFDERRR